ncbi:ethanolamine ammonia-lyase subunit EutB [Pectinatus haikarae]|uniref:Ethanolamine ammonia-lyase large subunit n=1 Tax=Pectinatus haikarae TaxID=349096 RepID=A0ABT9Y6C1_9FIRM|nr:ethanolamine ammonia-lyase subunit EutB [Pectinatus haikarae]MDQ0203380.1 ethanolamine ammonia-lyase large subunit [Pectinatus haikarae]
MKLKTRLFDQTYSFRDVKDVLAKANEEKSGDILAGVAAQSTVERVAAKAVLADMTLEDLRNNPVVPYETDDVTRADQDAVDEKAFAKIKSLTAGSFREFLLSAAPEEIAAVRGGLTSEIVAAAAKLMSNMDLVTAAHKLPVTATCNTTIGLPGTLSSRLQPNHATDDINGIMASVMEGVSYGVGDAVIGLNPAVDSIESVSSILKNFKFFMDHWQLPTQNCVLAHVTTQMKVLEQTDAPMDLMFQSLAGSELASRAFGIDVSLMDEAYAMMKEKKSSRGKNFMYFETGQGSELSSDGNHGADQLTMEARCYAFAKRYHPFLVNTVVGFIGPEYLYDGRQMIRAGLEDHFMGKLTGIPMGVDVCYTNHMKADQNDLENLAMMLTLADCNYIMGIPAGDDVMLMYQTTSYHDVAALRDLSSKTPIAAFAARMQKLGIMQNGQLTAQAGDPSMFQGWEK